MSNSSNITDSLRLRNQLKCQYQDDFNKYLKRQCVRTTFNGLEIESFSWYRKVLGLK